MLSLPVHPSRRHPLTGEPIQAVWVRPDGRVMWPMLGGDDTVEPAPEGGDGGDGGDGGPSGGGGGNDLGFPAETPIAEMTDKEQAAYWRHHSRQHESKYKDLLGGRKADEVKNDLAEMEKIRREKQTPAEQALEDARRQGEEAGRQAALTTSAEAILRGALEVAGVKAADLDELAESVNVARFIADGKVDTTKITNFAKRFGPSDTDDSKPRKRDFGAGNRGGGDKPAGFGSGGKAAAQQRFNQTKSGD